MKQIKRLFLGFFFFLLAFSSLAQADTLTTYQASKKVNEAVIVKAKVAGSRLFDKEGLKTFLVNLDEAYPDTPLTVVFYDEAFNALGKDENDLQDKTVVVSGTVTLYKGRPQIVITDVKTQFQLYK
jgi:hypothetical protein